MNPVNLRAIHQIELTSRCNLACVYCPNPNLGRPKVDITDEIFERALHWVDFFRERGTQYRTELNLTGIGESTLHPKLVEYVARVRHSYGEELSIVIPTNGLLLDDDLAKRLAPYHPTIFVSTHRPVAAARAIEVAKRYGLLAGASCDPATTPNDWAGQVDWVKPDYRFPCPWLHLARGFVTADGSILTCCLDATGASKISSVLDEPRSDVKMGTWKLCQSCYQDPPA